MIYSAGHRVWDPAGNEELGTMAVCIEGCRVGCMKWSRTPVDPVSRQAATLDMRN